MITISAYKGREIISDTLTGIEADAFLCDLFYNHNPTQPFGGHDFKIAIRKAIHEHFAKKHGHKIQPLQLIYNIPPAEFGLYKDNRQQYAPIIDAQNNLKCE